MFSVKIFGAKIFGGNIFGGEIFGGNIPNFGGNFGGNCQNFGGIILFRWNDFKVKKLIISKNSALKI